MASLETLPAKRATSGTDTGIASIKAYVNSLPEGHSYRKHLEQHVDLEADRILRLDRRCEDCQIYFVQEL